MLNLLPINCKKHVGTCCSNRRSQPVRPIVTMGGAGTSLDKAVLLVEPAFVSTDGLGGEFPDRVLTETKSECKIIVAVDSTLEGVTSLDTHRAPEKARAGAHSCV